MSGGENINKGVERKATKHIIIDEMSFEKLTYLRKLIKTYTQKKFTNSVLVELLVELAIDRIIERVEAEKDNAFIELSNKIDELSAKRGKKIPRLTPINISEVVSELNKIREMDK